MPGLPGRRCRRTSTAGSLRRSLPLPGSCPGRMGTGGAAAGVIYPAAFRARKADMGPGAAAATGRSARPGGSGTAVAPQLVGTRTCIRPAVAGRPGPRVRGRPAGGKAFRHPRLRRRRAARRPVGRPSPAAGGPVRMGAVGLAVRQGGGVMADDGQPGLPPFQLEVAVLPDGHPQR